MAEVVCDTSPIQYLYQLELLRILPALTERVIIPPAVVEEIAVGKAAGVCLPDIERFDWLEIRRSDSTMALPLVTDLGPGETEVLMLALESRDLVAVLDDALARRIAATLDRSNVPTFNVPTFNLQRSNEINNPGCQTSMGLVELD